MTTAPTYTGTYTEADAPASGPDRVAPLLSKDAEKRLAELEVENSQSVLFFGSTAQSSLNTISDSILEQVRSKDLGAAGATLNDMVLTLRGFDKSAADEGRPVGWLGRMLGRSRGAARLLQRYEAARDQIDAIGAKLQRHQNELLLDIEALDRLYSANLSQVHELEAYIDAGDTALARLEQQIAGASAAEKDAGAQDTLGAQRLRDLRAARDNLERRIHDLRLTRQVALQALPSIRLVQDNDKSLVAQIDSTLVNTVPLWRQQLAQAVTIQRARDAAQSIAAANDLTNDLLRANAENLRAANRETREQAERGVFDVEAIAEANRILIGTIEDSLRIAEEGRAARSKAVGDLREMEQQLRQALVSAKARSG
jgi:uncharacterized protein YaaN involved in tellurite resistance